MSYTLWFTLNQESCTREYLDLTDAQQQVWDIEDIADARYQEFRRQFNLID